jgi:hypothetical protein
LPLLLLSGSFSNILFLMSWLDSHFNTTESAVHLLYNLEFVHLVSLLIACITLNICHQTFCLFSGTLLSHTHSQARDYILIYFC